MEWQESCYKIWGNKMREIRFRVWNGLEILYPSLYFFEDYSITEWPEKINRADSLKIMQYTGLKDKNEKEIYEGDIVILSNRYKHLVKFGKWHLNSIKEHKIFGVGFYMEEIQTFKEKAIETNFFLTEIIGNIHENPDLLT